MITGVIMNHLKHTIMNNNDDIKKGDTVSINGISGVYFCEPKFGIVAIRPVPAVKMTAIDAIDLGGRGLHFHVTGQTKLYHIEQYEQGDISINAKVVLIEKSTENLLRIEKIHQRLIKD